MLRRLLLASLLLCAAPIAWAGGEVVFVASENNTMPLAAFEDGQISNGIVKDLGQAIARRLGRTARNRYLERNHSRTLKSETLELWQSMRPSITSRECLVR